jgi:hypothetical protein
MNPDLQRANDMLAAMQMQRDQALNAVVHAQAELAALRREVARLTPADETNAKAPPLTVVAAE